MTSSTDPNDERFIEDIDTLGVPFDPPVRTRRAGPDVMFMALVVGVAALLLVLATFILIAANDMPAGL